MYLHFKPLLLMSGAALVANINLYAGCVGVVAGALYAVISVYKKIKE